MKCSLEREVRSASSPRLALLPLIRVIKVHLTSQWRGYLLVEDFSLLVVKWQTCSSVLWLPDGLLGGTACVQLQLDYLTQPFECAQMLLLLLFKLVAQVFGSVFELFGNLF